MPSTLRRGEIYETVTEFVTSLHIGHYERYPQCPDLLRKSWKFVTELPYLPLQSMLQPDTASPLTASLGLRDLHSAREMHMLLNNGTRPIRLLFAGRLQLWGPERVCSVRNAIAELSAMKDVVVVNITAEEAAGPPDTRVAALMRAARFCIVSKADSYSTSFFYSALHAGCIPIVVSDWFVFSFPWAIPYSNFVIRILESDFLKNPDRKSVV